LCDQPAVEDDVAMAGASTDEEAGAAEDEAAGAADEDAAIGAASEDDAGAADDDTAAELEAGATVVVVGVPRLKIQIRPMMTITATMMIIQVLRFMGFTLGLRKFDREEF
jgi:hypothetical protein